MEPTLTPITDLSPRPDEEALVHEWRVERLHELGVPRLLAECFADGVEWRAVAKLVHRGCPPLLALEIVR